MSTQIISEPVKKVIDKIGLDPDLECAPNVQKGGSNTTDVCSTTAVIKTLKEKFNVESSEPKDIVEHAMESVGCGTESCLYKKIGSLPQDDLRKRFVPNGPKDSQEWLDNFNIDETLVQWTAVFPKFKHIPFQMIDFQEYGGELSKVDWSDFIKKYTCLGCIINTDRSSGPGKHWVCVFVDTDAKSVEYFDSAGDPPMPDVINWLICTSQLLSKFSGKQFRDIRVTEREHQLGNSECGVYSLFYILARLNGTSSSFFTYNRVSDEDMTHFRKYLFKRT